MRRRGVNRLYYPVAGTRGQGPPKKRRSLCHQGIFHRPEEMQLPGMADKETKRRAGSAGSEGDMFRASALTRAMEKQSPLESRRLLAFMYHRQLP